MSAHGTTSQVTAEEDPRRPRWAFYTVLGGTGLLYAYAVWNAIAYTIPLAGLALGAMTWVALMLSIVLPVVVYAVAIALTRRRRLGTVLLVLLAGLGVVAVFWLDVVGYTLSGTH